MKDIYIRCLSTPSVLKNGKPVVFQRNKSLVLFIYLHITGKQYSREELIDFLWPDLEPEKARANLRTVLSECRNLLGANIFLAENHLISLSPGCAGSDYKDFIEYSNSNNTEDLKDAEKLYDSSFLKATVIHKSSRFDDWQFEMQQQLEIKYSDLLEKLTRTANKEKDYNSEKYYLHKLIDSNPYDEQYYYRLIKLYSDSGEYKSAGHQYDNLKKVLKEDNLGEPDQKIQKLIAKNVENQKLMDHNHSEKTRKINIKKKIIFAAIFSAAAIFLIIFFAVNHRKSIILQSKTVSVAVLPFNFMCNDENAHVFAECFTIEMINCLSEQSYLNVKPAQTVSIYADSILQIKEIADELKVDYIIDGSAMSYNECIRFSVQLIEVKKDRCIWADSYNCKVDNSLKTELEIINYLEKNIVKQLLQYR